MQNVNGLTNNLPVNGYQSISKKDQTILYWSFESEKKEVLLLNIKCYITL
jgi:hypothetical protein